MLRSGIDQIMNEQLAPVLFVLVFIGALIWGLRRSITPVLIVNVLSAAATAIYIFSAPGLINLIYALGLFELGVLGTSAAALSGIRIPAWAIWLGFGINFVLLAAMTVFLLTFKMTRLF